MKAVNPLKSRFALGVLLGCLFASLPVWINGCGGSATPPGTADPTSVYSLKHDANVQTEKAAEAAQTTNRANLDSAKAALAADQVIAATQPAGSAAAIQVGVDQTRVASLMGLVAQYDQTIAGMKSVLDQQTRLIDALKTSQAAANARADAAQQAQAQQAAAAAQQVASLIPIPMVQQLAPILIAMGLGVWGVFQKKNATAKSAEADQAAADLEVTQGHFDEYAHAVANNATPEVKAAVKADLPIDTVKAVAAVNASLGHA